MKKIILLVLSIGMCFAFASCAELFEPIQSGNGSSTEMESTSDGLENSSDNETQYVTVTFKQEGKMDVVKTLEKGDNLTDIPIPAEKTGYNVIWDRTDFTGIMEDIVVNAKHKTSDGDKVYKKIPIPKQARAYINVNEPIECSCALDTLNRVFKRVMQDKEVTQYFLRHTFATTCVQYVRPDIVDTWMGG